MRKYQSMVMSSIALALFLGAAPAGATDFSIKGAVRNFCCTTPPAPLGGAPILPGPNGVRGGNGFNPAGGQTNPGVVQQTGTGTPNSPLSIKFPQGIIGTTTSAMFPNHPAPIFYTFSVTFSAYNEAGTMVKNGGAGDFSFCPTAMGPGVNACTAPSQAGPSPKHGRMFGEAGPNKFGGTMKLLGTGLVGEFWRVAFPGAPDKTHVHFTQPNAGVGQSQVGIFVAVPETSYMQTSMGMNGPMVTGNGSAAGAPWSTGYLLIQLSKNAQPSVQSVAITGSDNRTSMGMGNIALVSPWLHNNGAGAPSTNIRGNRLAITLPEPGAGLSVAVGALTLALIGLARARRSR